MVYNLNNPGCEGVKMTKAVKCRACGTIYELDEQKVTEKYIQCCYCSCITLNPFYEGVKDGKEAGRL